MKKLLFLSIILLFLLIPSVPFVKNHTVLAQGASTTTNYVDEDFPDAMDAAQDESKRDMNAVGHVASVNTTQFSDVIRRVLGPVTNITTNSENVSYLQQMRKNSFLYGAESIITYVYTNPPADTVAFFHDMGQTLGFIPKTAHAQGIGFSGLSALLPLWKVFRNIAYLLLALFMIVIGFFIMFRKKIDPKTVITVQNALPNIVVTLLLITFSYAIVGVLIDSMYLIIMIALSILKPVSKEVITADTASLFVSGNFGDTWHLLWDGGMEASLRGFLGLLGLKLPSPTETVTMLPTQGLLSYLINTNQAGPLQIAPTIIIVFFYAVAFLFAIIRLLVLLIQAYIQIIMSLLLSPLQLLLGVFPGSHAFEGWIKNLIVNLATFPIAAIMIMIGSIMAKYTTSGARLWGPPLLSPGGSQGMIGIISLGILFAIPSVVGSLKEALKAKAAVGMGMGGIISAGSTAGQQVFTYYLGKRQLENQMRGMQKFQDNAKNEMPAAGHK